jgi:predicted PurR-regulated permease PerM
MLLPAPSPLKTPHIDAVLAGAGVVLVLVMLALMHPALDAVLLGPPLLGVAAFLVLRPIREHRGVRSLLLAGGLLLTVWLLAVLRGALAPFVAVYIVAFVLAPVVTWLEVRGWRRTWAALLLTFVVLGVVVGLLLTLVPALVGEAQLLGPRLVNAVTRLKAWLASNDVLGDLAASGLIDRDAFLDQVSRSVEGAFGGLLGQVPATAQRLAASVGSVLGIVTVASLIPVLLFYTLRDFPRISRGLSDALPTVAGERAYLDRVEKIVGGYLRGQIIISSIAAFNVGLVLTLFGVPFSLLLGLLTGLLNLVPNLGALLTMIIGVVVALVFGDPVLKDVLVVVMTLLGQGLLEGAVLSPMILSQQVGLHPLLVLLSLFVFSAFFGFFGLLIAVPATALIVTYYRLHREHVVLDLTPDSPLIVEPRGEAEPPPPENPPE